MLEPRVAEVPMLPNQLHGLADIAAKIIIYRGGYRSGKTVFLVAKAIDLGLRNWPNPILVVEPSFPMIRSVFVETAIRMCTRGDPQRGVKPWGLAVHWAEAKKVLTIGARRPIKLLCRSADAPRSLEGLTVAGLIGDEWELWDQEALKVAMARVSIGACPQIVLGGTPEGFGPGYQLLERDPAPGTRVIVSRTIDNPHVTTGYAADMASRLTEEERQEKLEGERTMPSNRVYTRFERDLHCRTPCVDVLRARLEAWCDFNVDPMAWGFFLVDDERKAFHCVGELVVNGTDSQEHAAEASKWIRAWKKKHGLYEEHAGTPAVCDASGDERNAVTPLSHVINLEQAGFVPKFGGKNPFVVDRVASVQKVLGGFNPFGGMWPVRLTFDEKAAPYIVSCIANQPRAKDGSPSKDEKHGLDHGADLVGYGIMWHAPAFAPSPNGIEEVRAAQWEEWKRSGSG